MKFSTIQQTTVFRLTVREDRIADKKRVGQKVGLGYNAERKNRESLVKITSAMANLTA